MFIIIHVFLTCSQLIFITKQVQGKEFVLPHFNGDRSYVRCVTFDLPTTAIDPDSEAGVSV